MAILTDSPPDMVEGDFPASTSGPQLLSTAELVLRGALEAQVGTGAILLYPTNRLFTFMRETERYQPVAEGLNRQWQMLPDASLMVAALLGAGLGGRPAVGILAASHWPRAALNIHRLTKHATGQGAPLCLVVVEDHPNRRDSRLHDVRFAARDVQLPLLEPACPQEVKDWVGLALQLSRAAGSPVGLRIPASLASGGGTVQTYPFAELSAHAKPFASANLPVEPDHYTEPTPIAETLWEQQTGVSPRLQLLARLNEGVAESGLNRLLHKPQRHEVAPLGIIAAGRCYAWLNQALGDLRLRGRLPILKLGMVEPLDQEAVFRFAGQCRDLVVLENGNPLIEQQVRNLVTTLQGQADPVTEVFGRQHAESGVALPADEPLSPGVILRLLLPLIEHLPRELQDIAEPRAEREARRIEALSTLNLRLPDRQPTLCQPCLWRHSLSALVHLRDGRWSNQSSEMVQRLGDSMIFAQGDCAAFTHAAPFDQLEIKHWDMESAVGLLAGESSEDGQPVIILTDGKQAGEVNGLADALPSLAERSLTVVVHDRVACQPSKVISRPSDSDDDTPSASTNQVARRYQTEDVTQVYADQRDLLMRILCSKINQPGLNVIHLKPPRGPNGLAPRPQLRRAATSHTPGVNQRYRVRINAEACVNCLGCVQLTGCSSLQPILTVRGTRWQIDETSCSNDGPCTSLLICPAFEIAENAESGTGDESIKPLPTGPRQLAEPIPPIHARQEIWRLHLAGVGGQGMSRLLQVISRAAQLMDYHVQYTFDGRIPAPAGSVCAQVVVSRAKPVGDTQFGLQVARQQLPPKDPTPREADFLAAEIPFARADVLLALDPIEAARAATSTASHRVAGNRTILVSETLTHPTADERALGQSTMAEDVLQQTLAVTHPKASVAFGFAEFARTRLKDVRLANMVMLGWAYQAGLLPLTEWALTKAIESSLPKAAARCSLAFRWGRALASARMQPVAKPIPSPRKTLRLCIRKIRQGTGSLLPGKRRHEKLADHFREQVLLLFRNTSLRELSVEIQQSLIVGGFDALQWGGRRALRQYLQQVEATLSRFAESPDLERIAHIAIAGLARAWFAPDELLVARQLTDKAADEQPLPADSRHSQKPLMRYPVRIELPLLHRRHRYTWRARRWHLQLLAGLRPIRLVTPYFHRIDRRFARWFVEKLNALSDAPGPVRNQQLAVLALAETVSGYRQRKQHTFEQMLDRADRWEALSTEAFNERVIDAGLAPDGFTGNQASLPVHQI